MILLKKKNLNGATVRTKLLTISHPQAGYCPLGQIWPVGSMFDARDLEDRMQP